MDETQPQPEVTQPHGFWRRIRSAGRDAIAALRTRRRLLMEVTIVNIVMGGVLIFAPEPTFTLSTVDAVWFGVMVIVHILSLLLTFGVLKVLLEHNSTTSLFSAMKWVCTCIVPFSILLVIWCGVLFVSSMIFLVPALIVGVYGIFTFAVYMVEGKTGVAALVRSTELVYGRWWSTFGILTLVIGGLSLLLMIPLFGLVLAFSYAPYIVGSPYEIVAVILIVLYAFMYEAVMLLIGSQVVARLYQLYAASAVTFSDATKTKLRGLFRTLAYLGWVVPLIALLVGVWFVMQDPVLMDRIILYFLTGV